MTRHINVLDHGYVTLIDHMGDDLAVVQAAQASLDNESQTYGDREAGILRFLMREEHGVPFEHVVLKYKMRLPLKLAAQLKKHRMASWSEQSSRYDEMEPLFYLPDEDDVRTQVGKVGAYTFDPVEDHVARTTREFLKGSYEESFATYKYLLSIGVAREIASLSLPVGLYTTVVWTLNVRSLFNVIHLRADSHAQLEARRYAVAFEELAKLVIPDTIAAFVAAGRPKP